MPKRRSRDGRVTHARSLQCAFEEERRRPAAVRRGREAPFRSGDRPLAGAGPPLGPTRRGSLLNTAVGPAEPAPRPPRWWAEEDERRLPKSIEPEAEDTHRRLCERFRRDAPHSLTQAP